MSSSEKEKKLESKSDMDNSATKKESPNTNSSANSETPASRLSLAAALSRIIHFGSSPKHEPSESDKERESHPSADMKQENEAIHQPLSAQKLTQILEQPKEALEEPLSSSSASDSEEHGHLEQGKEKQSSPIPSALTSSVSSLSSSSSDQLSVSSSSSDGHENDHPSDAPLLDHTDILLDGGESSSLFDSSESDSAEREEKKKHTSPTILSSYSVKHRLQLIRKEFLELKSLFNLKEVDVIGGDDNIQQEDDDNNDDDEDDDDNGSNMHSVDETNNDPTIRGHDQAKDQSPELEHSIAAMLLSLPARDEHRQTPSRIPWIVRLDIPYHYPAVRPVIKYVSHKGELLPNLKELKKAFQERVPLPLASLRAALLTLQHIMATESVPRITPDPLTNTTVLVRDYGYSLLDARFYGKERDYSIGASELLEYEDEDHLDGQAKRSSGVFDPWSGRRKSRLPKDRAVALYAFQPELEGEMALAEGDPIYILERPGNGWLLASKCNAPELFGYVPENYVKPIKK